MREGAAARFGIRLMKPEGVERIAEFTRPAAAALDIQGDGGVFANAIGFLLALNRASVACVEPCPFKRICDISSP